jgi:hypothetical protein
MPRQTKHTLDPIPARDGQHDIDALSSLSPIPEGFVGYSGTQSTDNSAKIIDIKKPNGLYSPVLENEKKEFVGYLTARFGVDPEVATQAYERLSPNFNREASTRPPEIAPELYAERRNRDEKAPAFLLRVYGQWLGTEPVLFQPMIRRIDPALLQGLINFYRVNTGCVDDVLPKKSKEIDARLGAGAETMTTTERKRVLSNQYGLVRK